MTTPIDEQTEPNPGYDALMAELIAVFRKHGWRLEGWEQYGDEEAYLGKEWIVSNANGDWVEIVNLAAALEL